MSPQEWLALLPLALIVGWAIRPGERRRQRETQAHVDVLIEEHLRRQQEGP